MEEEGGACEPAVRPLMEVAESHRGGYGKRVGRELMEEYLAVEEMFNHRSEVRVLGMGQVARRGM